MEKTIGKNKVEMAKLEVTLVVLCFFSATMAVSTHEEHKGKMTTFVLEGKVYCDTCRAGFETTLTEYIGGAKVRLECRNSTTHEVLHELSGETDPSGTYHLKVEHDHEEEICEVVLVSSPQKGCDEIKGGRDRARILITTNSGLATNIRYPNSLGFLKKEPLEPCKALLKQYALSDDED